MFHGYATFGDWFVPIEAPASAHEISPWTSLCSPKKADALRNGTTSRIFKLIMLIFEGPSTISYLAEPSRNMLGSSCQGCNPTWLFATQTCTLQNMLRALLLQISRVITSRLININFVRPRTRRTPGPVCEKHGNPEKKESHTHMYMYIIIYI